MVKNITKRSATKEKKDEIVKSISTHKIGIRLYWEIDDARIYTILENYLGDVKKFLDSLWQFLKWRNGNSNEEDK